MMGLNGGWPSSLPYVPVILPRSTSSRTTLSTKRARCFSATKSATVTGSNSGSSIFHGRNVLLIPRTESDSRFLGQQNPLLLRQAPSLTESEKYLIQKVAGEVI